jgi:dihydrodipicolinate synthase/N-acetylneuraminate lyase
VQSVEHKRPRRGLSIPVITVIDDQGRLQDADQRALVRYVAQEGRGADVIFAAGTTGEWAGISQAVRQQVVRVCSEEVRKINIDLRRRDARGVEIWAGVTAPDPDETLENLEAALACGADAAVLAPLSIQGVDDPIHFVARDVGDLLDRSERRIPVYLYDNADIALNPRAPHIRTRQVKALSRLDFVRGIKVSAPRRVLGNYTKAAASFNERGEFGIYVGDAMLIFDLFRPRRGVLGAIAEHWQRYRLRDTHPCGVVAGPANVMPREWARAWQVCCAGDEERMEELQEVLAEFRAGTRAAAGKRTIACLKRALRNLGIIASASVAPGTPELTEPDGQRFDELFEQVRSHALARLGGSASVVPDGLESALRKRA